MPIGFNSGGTTTTFEDGLGGGPTSFANQVTTAGSDRIGFVTYEHYKPFSSSPTIGFEWGSGNTMTLVQELSLANDLWMGLFYILAPPTALTTIDIIGPGGIMVGGVFSAFDVNQTTPFVGFDDDVSQDHLDIASASGEVALLAAAGYNGTPYSVSAPATQIGTVQQAFFPINVTAGYDAGASPFTTITLNQMAEGLVGISLKPTGGGGGGNPWYAFAQQRERVTRLWNRRSMIFTPSYAYQGKGAA